VSPDCSGLTFSEMGNEMRSVMRDDDTEIALN
jgi:hypothetical protein